MRPLRLVVMLNLQADSLYLDYQIGNQAYRSPRKLLVYRSEYFEHPLA